MDDLVHHCLRELSFDGDLGSNVSRLRDFIIGFYAQPGVLHTQILDDSFCAFIWSLVVQQPSVRVGTIPDGLKSEVWIAPQTSKKKKAKEREEGEVDTKPPELHLVMNAKSRSLESLVEEYGNRLRIAVEPNAIYEAVTGSHIRFAKLSPMVYSALQIITRGRDDGASVVSLGKQSGYDQKTCFYLIKQLQELNLVVKVPKPGVGTNFAIHRYFFEKSPHWKAIREEENKAEEEDKVPRQMDEEFLDEETTSERPALDFTPIDARHLSSLPLVKARVVKLLKASKNNIHESNNMLITLGFSNPTKTDRRFFQSRIRELIQQGVIEKVVVPSSRKKSTAHVRCFRLATSEKPEGVVLDTQEEDEADEGAEAAREVSGIKMNFTIHRQIFSLLEEAGTRGMTLSDLSTALCHFDKRTIELLLTRADKVPPPAHLSDLGIAGLMETHGRERRHRYYTVAAYRRLVAQEQLDPSSAGYSNVDFSKVGSFGTLDPDIFYEDKAALIEYQDTYKGDAGATSGKKATPKSLSTGPTTPGQPRKRAKGVTGDGQGAKSSRKRKIDTIGNPPSALEPSAKKQRVAKDQAPPMELNVPKRRGRPPKNKVAPVEVVSRAPSAAVTQDVDNVVPSVSQAVVKKRGRPSKKRPIKDDTGESTPQQSKRKKDSHQTVSSVIDGGSSPPAGNVASAVEVTTGQTLLSGLNEGSSGNSGGGAPSTMQSEPTVIQPTDTRPPIQIGAFAEALVLERDDIPIDPALQDIPSQPPPYPAPFVVSDTNKSTNARNRINVSHLRRQGEMYRVIENLGGIVNTQSREFSDAHAAILDNLFKSSGPASAPPGTKTDKRTVTAALDALESQGRIRQLKTSVQSQAGINRPVRVAYLPHITEAQLGDYLAELSKALQPVSQATFFVKIDERVEYGADPTSLSRSLLPLQLLQLEQPGTDKKERWSKNMARANQLFKYDDQTIREVLLAERTTSAQLYGFIVGKMARIREFHLTALRALESNQSYANVLGKENKIFDISFFCHDLPLGEYCSFVSCLAHNQDLSNFFSAKEGRQTPVRDLPAQLHSFMQIGRSRARSRFLEMLEVLRFLGVVTPLRISASDNPWITCEGNGKDPYKFDRASLEGWTTSTPLAAPSFWKFNDVASLFLWRESETNPPFWKEVPIDGVASASQFWDSLRTASVETSVCPNGPLSTEPHSTHSVSVSLARSLRRQASWNMQYILTWHQKQYLRQFVHVHETPLEEPDDVERDTLMGRICRVTSAPRDVISTFYKETREKLLRELEKAKQKRKRPSDVEKRARRTAEVKGLLAKKAAEARRKREQEWDALLLRVHAGSLSSAASSRVKRVQKRFLEAGSTQETEKWEKDIADAIREAHIAKSLKIGNKPSTELIRPFPAPPPLALNPVEPSVQSLIARQGTPLEPKEPPKKRRREGDKAQDAESTETQTKVTRRHRFQWTRDYDELARDAAAIIRARCRNIARVDWAAFEQVFPAVPRNTVRQRLAHIREAPGNEAYMNRLEEKWYELWVQHRGTPLLPDDEPQSASNFDLARHIEFMRKHIDKNALRVGYGHTRESGIVTLPSTIEELLDEYQVDIPDGPGLTWDFMWNANVEEGREKRLMRQAFTQTIEEVPSFNEPTSDSVALAEAALKMTLGTPSERYDADQGALVLQSVGQKNVEAAAKSMISRGVLSKLVRDPQRSKPGRHLRISDMNLNTVGGAISGDTFQDAVALEEVIAQDGAWREWPLTASDGDCAALVELVMENKLDFKIDTTQAQAARMALDWNSKKADDDQIETLIFYQRTLPSNQTQPDPEAEENSDEVMGESSVGTTTGHGFSEHGEAASCKIVVEDSNLTDCAACLERQMTILSEDLGPDRRVLLRRALEVVESAGKDGIIVPTLQVAVGVSKSSLLGAIQDLTKAAIPLIYWTGYASLVLVSASFIKYWSATVSENPIKRVFPRRWLDTEGHRIAEFWELALKTVVGLVIFRPGISQMEIRWRLRSTYDRQEVHDITYSLLMEGFLRVQLDPGQEASQDVNMPLDDNEGRHVFYFVGDRRWYQA